MSSTCAPPRSPTRTPRDDLRAELQRPIQDQGSSEHCTIHPQPALLRTCKQIRQEALGTFLRYIILETTSLSRLQRFVQNFDPESLRKVREVRLQEFDCTALEVQELLEEVEEFCRKSTLRKDVVRMPIKVCEGGPAGSAVVWVNLRELGERRTESQEGKRWLALPPGC